MFWASLDGYFQFWKFCWAAQHVGHQKFILRPTQQKMDVAQQINYVHATCWANYVHATVLGQHFVGPTLLAQHVGGQQNYVHSLKNLFIENA